MNQRLVKCIVEMQIADVAVKQETKPVKNSYFLNLFNSVRLVKATVPVKVNY